MHKEFWRKHCSRHVDGTFQQIWRENEISDFSVMYSFSSSGSLFLIQECSYKLSVERYCVEYWYGKVVAVL
jgi:hypothetical protein